MNTVSSGVLDIIGLKIASGAIIVDGTESIGQAGGDDFMNYFVHDRSQNSKQQRIGDKGLLSRLRYKGTLRQFEDSRLITADRVRADLKRIQDFAVHGGTQTDASSPR